MAFKLFSDVRETSTTGGTGDQVLTGSPFDASYFRFNDRYSNADTFFYCMKQGVTREIGFGTRVASGDKVSRTQVYKSTNANALVNFTNGQTIDIFVTNIAPQDLDAAGLVLWLSAHGSAASGILASRNLIDNPQFQIDQRNLGAPAGTATADNAYWADRWRYIGESTATLFSQDYANFVSGKSSGVVQLTTANSKGGIFHVVESADCTPLRGQQVTLGLSALISDARIGNIKAGIIEWTGTANATTGDPVTTWGADGVTPTLAANWAFKNTPANLSIAGSVTAITPITVTLGSSFTNLAVMIWCDDKVFNANDYFRVSDIQLVAGTVLPAFDQVPIANQLARCQRRYYRRRSASTADYITQIQAISATTALGKLFDFPVPMAAAPSTPAISAASHLSALQANAGGSSACSAITLAANEFGVWSTSGTYATGLVAGSAALLFFNSASGWIEGSSDI